MEIWCQLHCICCCAFLLLRRVKGTFLLKESKFREKCWYISYINMQSPRLADYNGELVAYNLLFNDFFLPLYPGDRFINFVNFYDIFFT